MDVMNTCEMLAQRVRQARFDADFTQADVAARAMISLPAYRRFEKTGQTSLVTFVKILAVLGRENDLRSMLARTTDKVSSLDEFEQRRPQPRFRVRKKNSV
jgi:transcriptional regulator with XRE-family HTH domain